MNLRRFLIEGATLIISAIILGLVANVMAGTERQVSLAAANAPERRVESRTGQETEPMPVIEEGAERAPQPTAPARAEADAQTSPAESTKASKEEMLERFPPSPDVPAEDIHTEDAKWLWDQGALFLDARRTSIYQQGHIPGARPFAIWEADIEKKVKDLSTEGLDPDIPIVIYCSGGECEDSHLLAQKLWGMFFNNLLVYHEGFPGWKDAGYPVDRGAGS
ncbi:MAG: rhodanese-like domain-containing protein [Thermoanaerobaculia bacterium]|nr:rhodanese-like domain-containing protein [Thermoanaerobaculia bacterium]